MKISFNAVGKDRKKLAVAISDFIAQPVDYQGAPSFAYKIGACILDRYAVLECHGVVVSALLSALADKGFTYSIQCEPEPDAAILDETPGVDAASAIADETTALDASADVSAEADAEPDVSPAELAIVDAAIPESEIDAASVGAVPAEFTPVSNMGLTIEMPRQEFTYAALENLKRLVSSKAALIKKSVNAYDLSIIETENKICFPWFPADSEPDAVDAYTRLIVALCAAAQRQKHVVGKERQVENEKFAFRVFLVRLGFIGAETKSARAVLLKNLVGNSAWKNGRPPMAGTRPEPPASVVEKDAATA
jgi:hypothetical protein